MAFDAYLQRADDYIMKQIQKFEQQKRGNRSPPRANGYHQMPRYQPHSQEAYPGSPAPPPPPPPGPMLPHDWAREFDSQSQRWYYIHKPTGATQWHPPPHAPPAHRAATFQPDNTSMPTPYQHFSRADEARFRARSSSQPQRPGSAASGGAGPQAFDPRQNGGTASASPGLHSQLPPGAHLDMKTGKIVHSMFPEGQTAQSWAQEIQRI